MAWIFDSGLQRPTRTLVRQAVLAKLQPLLKPTGFCSAIIEVGFPIVNAHDDLGIDLLEKELINRTPAIAVATCDCHDSPAGAPDRSLGKLEVELYFFSTHRRGTTQGRTTGDAVAAARDNADPGLDVMMQLAWQLLFDAPMVLDDARPRSQQRAQPMKRSSEQHVITTEQHTIWKQTWSTQVTYDANLYRDVTQKLIEAYTTSHQANDPAPAEILTITEVGE